MRRNHLGVKQFLTADSEYWNRTSEPFYTSCFLNRLFHWVFLHTPSNTLLLCKSYLMKQLKRVCNTINTAGWEYSQLFLVTLQFVRIGAAILTPIKLFFILDADYDGQTPHRLHRETPTHLFWAAGSFYWISSLVVLHHPPYPLSLSGERILSPKGQNVKPHRRAVHTCRRTSQVGEEIHPGNFSRKLFHVFTFKTEHGWKLCNSDSYKWQEYSDCGGTSGYPPLGLKG